MSVFRRIMLGGLSVDISTLPDTQKIYYTATRKVVPGDGAFNTSVIANEYNDVTKEGVIACGNDITLIGASAFEYCYALESITIPDSVTSIGGNAFYYCESLTSITIPDSVTSIGAGAFEYCSSLTSITIGNSVTSIGAFAFQGCDNLTKVYVKSKIPPALVNNSFTVSSELIIYVPNESVEAYKSAWSRYAEYILGYDFSN